MKIPFGDLTVYFPYDYVYPEQYDYMMSLKELLDSGSGHCLLEMPTGTGKTVSLLSLIVSYQLYQPSIGKLIYCTRTVQEMDKVMQEIKRVLSYIERETRTNTNTNSNIKSSTNISDHLCVCLSSRRNLCIHPSISKFDDPSKIDSLCRNRTASWIRTKARLDSNSSMLCKYYEKYMQESGLENIKNSNYNQPSDMEDLEDMNTSNNLDKISGIYSLHDLKQFGHKKQWCPYFLSRYLINIANIIVYNYQYMLDPKISNIISKNLNANCIVVFDEAHNIDNICIEALSVKIDKRIIHSANRNISNLCQNIKSYEHCNQQRLQNEYQSLLKGLTSSSNISDDISYNVTSSVLSKDIIQQSIPGNIRKAKHFLNFLKTLIEYIYNYMKNIRNVKVLSSVHFINEFKYSTNMNEYQMLALKHCYHRLYLLFFTLRITSLNNFSSLISICNFASLIATYDQGFQILIEPYDNRTPYMIDPILYLVCQDASIAIQPIFEKYKYVIITSGTLSPINFYIKILNFQPKIIKSFNMTLSYDCICPIIVGKGNDQIPITSKFQMRNDISVVKNYGELLFEMSGVIPDGIVCFFTSYAYMEEMICEWSKLGILQNVMENKLIFIETRDIIETSLALDSFKKSCDCGRGAIFLSVARGKVSEGIDFNGHYGRCVILFGIPYQYSRSRVLGLRLEYMKNVYGISENEFLSFDALRQAAQCVGRVIRSKLDYGLMIFADIRYSRADKWKKLPHWLSMHLKQEFMNLSIDVAVEIAAKFVKQMAQPHSKDDQIGRSLLSLKDVKRKIKQNEMKSQFNFGANN